MGSLAEVSHLCDNMYRMSTSYPEYLPDVLMGHKLWPIMYACISHSLYLDNMYTCQQRLSAYHLNTQDAMLYINVFLHTMLLNHTQHTVCNASVFLRICEIGYYTPQLS